MKYITLLFIFLVHFSFSQSVGFFGKKNVISFNGIGAIPIIQSVLSNSQHSYYKSVNGKFIRTSDYFNGGFSAGISHAFSNSFGLGFDFETVYSNCSGPNFGFTTYDELNNNYYNERVEIYHEALSLRTFNFIPKIEFQLSSNYYPIGIVNQIGFGYTTSKVIDKEYDFLIQYPTYNNLKEIEDDKIFNLEDNYSGLTFMYAFNVRVPISKSLLFNYGIRYNLNYTFGAKDGGGFLNNSTTDKENYAVSKRTMQQIIGNSRFKNIITLNVGLSLVI